MFARHKMLALILLVSLFAAACRAAEPTVTSVPPTATQIALEPTDTRLPPSDTPVPPTATAVQPTATAPPTTEPASAAAPIEVEEITFRSSHFALAGDLQIPDTGGKHPAIIMVHGDGGIDRTCFGIYRPIMERFLRAGYAVFSWDKPGTGESTGRLAEDAEKLSQRAAILVSAVERLKEHPAVDPERIGAWGISQAGYVIPLAMQMTDDITFVILTSGPAMDSYDQGAFLTGQIAFCAGGSQTEAEQIEGYISKAEKASTYQEYRENTTRLLDHPQYDTLGLSLSLHSESQWEPENSSSLAFFNPIQVVEQTTIPILAIFGEKDRQVDPFQGSETFQEAFRKAGAPHSQVALFPDADHNIILSETGCLDERESRSLSAWLNYAPGYLDLMEAWLLQLPTSLPSPSSSAGAGSAQIAFWSDRDGNDEIYVMAVLAKADADGSEPQNLTNHPASDTDPAWSPDGLRIAFSSDRSGNYDIYVMDADGTNPQRLTQNPAVDAQPTWSPDGTKIAFVSLRDGNAEIYVMDADGSGRRRLTSNQTGDHEPDWSPDGMHIVFASSEGDYANICVMASDGSGRRQLTDTDAHDFYPRWSPDGRQIAFLSTRDGSLEEVYIMDQDGSDQRRLTSNDAFDGAPSWSPDGTRFVFASDRDGNHELYVMNSDGTDVRRLTDRSAADRKPAWRPVDAMGGGKNTWTRTFEGSDYGAFFDIVVTEDGNLLAVGTTNHLHFPPYSGDALFMKLTLDGGLLWERTWGGDGYEQAWSVALAEDGGYYIFGETDSYGAGGRDFFLLKTDEDGTEDWFRTYGRAHREWPYGMLRLSNGDLLIYGFTEDLAGSGRHQYALRVGPDGEVIWEYLVENPEDELVLDALETAEGDLVLAVGIGEDGKLVKLDADGTVQWTNRYELPGWQFASQIAQVDNGGFLLAGFAMSSGSRRQADTWLVRCTPTGELEWERSFGDSTFDDYAQSLIRLSDGTYLIGGIGNGMLLSRIDQDGKVLWSRSLLGKDVYGAEALIEIADGGYLIAGFIQITNGRSYDAILLRTDAEGWVEE